MQKMQDNSICEIKDDKTIISKYCHHELVIKGKILWCEQCKKNRSGNFTRLPIHKTCMANVELSKINPEQWLCKTCNITLNNPHEKK
jgi:hypothetical protein